MQGVQAAVREESVTAGTTLEDTQVEHLEDIITITRQPCHRPRLVITMIPCSCRRVPEMQLPAMEVECLRFLEWIRIISTGEARSMEHLLLPGTHVLMPSVVEVIPPP